MQRVRAWMRQWLGIEALEAQHHKTWAAIHQVASTVSPTPTPPSSPSPTAPSVSPREPEFFDPVMGRL